MNILEILNELIAIDTTNPPGNEKYIVEYIKNFFKDKAKLIEIEHGNNRSSLIVRFEGKQKKTLSIVGHIDTVPIGNASDWKYHPFEAKVENDYIYGRGTSDMKSGVSCMISIGDHLINHYDSLPINIDLVFTADEETGGMGVKEINKQGYFNNTEFIMVPEPTSLKLGTKEKGTLWLEISVKGRSAHGAYPEKGLNAIDTVFAIKDELKLYLEKSPKDDLLNKSTISLNKIEGGNKINIIADNCDASMDIRYTPSLKSEDIKDQFNRIINKYIELGYLIEYEIINDRASLATDPNSIYISSLREVLKEFKIAGEEVGIYYYTDASDIVPYTDIPFLLFGPGLEEECHKADEKAPIKNIILAEKIYIEWVDRIINTKI